MQAENQLDEDQLDENRPSTEDIAGTHRAQEAPDAPLELFGRDQVDRFRGEWRDLQARFVDEPREAVQGADHLVAEVMQSLAGTFNDHKHELEGQWQHGSEVKTEELRLALRRYRTFFDQLLNA